MKVSDSTFLQQRKPALQHILSALSEEYAYASILGQDSSAKRYTLSAQGSSVSQDAVLTRRGFVIRVTDNRGYGEYACSDVTEDTIPVILEAIRSNLIALQELPEGLSFMEKGNSVDEPLTFNGSSEYAIHPGEIGDGVLLEKLAGLRTKGMEMDARIVDVSARVDYQEVHKTFLSRNRDLTQNLLWTGGTLLAFAAKGQEMKVSYKACTRQAGGEVLEDMDALLPTAVQKALDLLDSRPIVPGVYECVCTPDVTGMIVHEAFGHGVEMDMFVKDRALARSYIGKRVASPLVTMHDGSILGKQTGGYFFDDEGTFGKDTVIIDKGILRTGISDIRSAEALSTQPTGNGRRESFERKAYTRMTNTFFEGGTDSVEDMIASVSYGFLLDEPSSGMEDPKNWGIQCMVSIAREIKDGKLTGKVFSPIVLTGYVPDLLCSISMMSPNVVLSGSGFCGKGYKEWVKVSDGGPYIKATIRLG